MVFHGGGFGWGVVEVIDSHSDKLLKPREYRIWELEGNRLIPNNQLGMGMRFWLGCGPLLTHIQINH